MSQHTPGPWTIEADGAGWYIESNLISTFVASVENAKWNDYEEGDVVPTEEEQEANARLIAAAPDLLEALSEMYHAFLDPDHIVTDRQEAASLGAYRAIYKATGKNT